ncbi:hypothetical protein Nepgr_011058 [Nepenthes gracilis]|uniref:Zinc finger PHD-type domain-containing protein n=1 Tax=Nepenthes gracilis TaxID=150966 RepID=A0AAD3SDK5_NEPGR|nr:hypothetical protein Nepgr_011058 [Nepenthes gracilis]
MKPEEVGNSAEVSLKRRACSGRLLTSSAANCSFISSSSYSSLFENVESKANSGVLGTCECTEMHQSVNTGQIIVRDGVLNRLDCHGDDVSCISKADGTNIMMGAHRSDADHKTSICSSDSVNSFLPTGFQKSITIQDSKEIPDSGQCLVKEKERYLPKPRDALQLTEYFSDRSDPSETSLCRNEPSAAISLKGEPVQCSVEQVDLSVARAECDEHMHAKSSTVESEMIDRNKSADDALNSSEQNEHLKISAALDDLKKQELPSQSHAMGDNVRLDELIDVRACDICGDVGREALLAICAKCSDGAEHIYCMRTKMDKVPEGDWMCEECMLMEKEQGKIQDDDEKSLLNVKGQSSVELNSSVKDNDKIIQNRICSTSYFSRKRCNPGLQVSPSVKRRALGKDFCSWGLSASNTRTLLQQNSSMEMNNGQYPLRLASSFQDHSSNKMLGKECSVSFNKSSKIEPQSAGGYLLQRKLSNSSVTHFKVQSGSTDKKRKIMEASVFHNTKEHAFRKLSKSISFSGANTVHSDVSASKTKIAEDVKSLRCGIEQKMLRRAHSLKINSTQPNSRKHGSGISKLKANERVTVLGDSMIKLLPREKRHHLKTTEFLGNLNMATEVGCIISKGSSCAKISAGSAEEKMTSTQENNVPSSPVKIASSYRGLKESQSFQKAEPEPISRDVDSHLRTSEEIVLDSTPLVKELPTFSSAGLVPSSVVPKHDCIWKGVFKLEKGGKLPSYCDGIHAHLSTSASSKVLQVVHKFPHEILLKEVPRLDTWPVQFQKTGAMEDDIALYFFAEDLQSYIQSYKRLLECMVMNDLSLKANFNGVELLIFPSVVLPQRSQRWNNLSFLWGVFRARKISSPDYISVCSSRKRIHIPSLSAVTPDQDLSITAVSGPQTEIFSVPMGEDLSSSHVFDKSVRGLDLQSAASTGCTGRSCGLDISVNNKNFGDLQHREDLQKEDNKCQNPYPEIMLEGNASLIEQQSGKTVVGIAAGIGERHHGSCNSLSYTGLNYSSHMFSPQINDSASQFTPKSDRHDVAHGLEMLEKSSRSSVSLDSGPSAQSDSGDWIKLDECQVEARDGAPNLELSLGNATKPPKQCEPVLFLSLANRRDDQGPHHRITDGVEGDISVALSLALPCSSKEVMSENFPKADVDTPLLLFGGVRKL